MLALAQQLGLVREQPLLLPLRLLSLLLLLRPYEQPLLFFFFLRVIFQVTWSSFLGTIEFNEQRLFMLIYTYHVI